MLAACHDKPVTVRETVETPLSIFAPTRAALERTAGVQCSGLAETSRATLLSSRLVNVAGDSEAGFTTTARCTLDQPRADTRRVLGNATASESQPPAK